MSFPQPPSSQSPIPQIAVNKVIDNKIDLKECKSDTEMIEDDEPTCCTLNQTTQTLIENFLMEDKVGEAPVAQTQSPAVAVQVV